MIISFRHGANQQQAYIGQGLMAIDQGVSWPAGQSPDPGDEETMSTAEGLIDESWFGLTTKNRRRAKCQ